MAPNNTDYGSFSVRTEKVLESNSVYVNIQQKAKEVFFVCSMHKYVSASCLFYIYLVFYALYLALGALAFSLLESPGNDAVRDDVLVARHQFLAQYPNVLDEDLEKLIVEIVRASNRGVSATRNVTNQPNWSFGQSMFFSSTVVTTIGYGHVTPLSRSGKIFCIAYATCGIPLTLVLMSALVERLMKPALILLQALNSRLGHRYQAFNIRILHLFIIVAAVVIFFMILPAGVFALIEPGWDYLDSFYYCFISLTTIGLGDYIPGDSPNQELRPFYKIATTFYLLIGLTFMMLALAIFYDIPQLNIGLLFKAPGEQQDSEKARLSSFGYGLQYGMASGSDQSENTHMQVVRVRSRHRDDSPSPEEPLTKKDQDH